MQYTATKVKTASKDWWRFNVKPAEEGQPTLNDLYFKASDFPNPPEAFEITIKPVESQEPKSEKEGVSQEQALAQISLSPREREIADLIVNPQGCLADEPQQGELVATGGRPLSQDEAAALGDSQGPPPYARNTRKRGGSKKNGSKK